MLLMFFIKYRSEVQFLPCFIWHFVNLHFVNETETGPVSERRGGCSLFTRFSVYTVGLEPSEKTTTSPPSRFRSGFRFIYKMPIFKMPNKTLQKLYFAMILDEEHHRTPLHRVSHFWKRTLRGVLRTRLWMPIASHCEAGAIRNRPNTGDRTNIQNFGVNHSISS